MHGPRALMTMPLLLFLGACHAEEKFIPPPPPPIGFQIHLLPISIMPGEDREYCTYFNLDMPDKLRAEGRPVYVQDIIANGVDPEAPEIAVDQIDGAGAPGLHHIQVRKLE